MTTKISIEDFMIEARQASGMDFDTFHDAFAIANQRRNRTLYVDIKCGQITVTQLVILLKKFGA